LILEGFRYFFSIISKLSQIGTPVLPEVSRLLQLKANLANCPESDLTLACELKLADFRQKLTEINQFFRLAFSRFFYDDNFLVLKDISDSKLRRIKIQTFAAIQNAFIELRLIDTNSTTSEDLLMASIIVELVRLKLIDIIGYIIDPNLFAFDLNPRGKSFIEDFLGSRENQFLVFREDSISLGLVWGKYQEIYLNPVNKIVSLIGDLLGFKNSITIS
jgi:hypothetical protein